MKKYEPNLKKKTLEKSDKRISKSGVNHKHHL